MPESWSRAWACSVRPVEASSRASHSHSDAVNAWGPWSRCRSCCAARSSSRPAGVSPLAWDTTARVRSIATLIAGSGRPYQHCHRALHPASSSSNRRGRATSHRGAVGGLSLNASRGKLGAGVGCRLPERPSDRRDILPQDAISTFFRFFTFSRFFLSVLDAPTQTLSIHSGEWWAAEALPEPPAASWSAGRIGRPE